jgi:hypothetical protein
MWLIRVRERLLRFDLDARRAALKSASTVFKNSSRRSSIWIHCQNVFPDIDRLGVLIGSARPVRRAK